MNGCHTRTRIRCDYDVVVIGGGLAGVCAALAAARQGSSTLLIQDRPVLGGNSSAEIGVTPTGANGFHFRYGRETGLLDELVTENLRFNPGDSKSLWSLVLWSACTRQDNLDLLLNTIAKDPQCADHRIETVIAEQYTTEKTFEVAARTFVDCSGDGRIAYEAETPYMAGREAACTFDESLAPEKADSFTMGTTLTLHARDAGRPVPFTAPEWAYGFPEEVFGSDRKHELRHLTSPGGGYWWIELGGKLDTIAEAEQIRDALWKYALGVWDHIKNHGEHGADTYQLESVNWVPGRRESRRFVGDYILRQHDIDTLHRFPDTVAYGGWFLDLHLPTGLTPELPGPYWHGKGVTGRYSIPLRCLYARNLDNLFLAGRNISASHVAFASTRVMGTCAVTGQAAGTAAALAAEHRCSAREIRGHHLTAVQQTLLKHDCYLPCQRNRDPEDQARLATVSATSEASLYCTQFPTDYHQLDRRRAQSFVLSEPRLDAVTMQVRNTSVEPVVLRAHLRTGEFIDDFRSKTDLAVCERRIDPGTGAVRLDFNVDRLPAGGAYWILLEPADGLAVGFTPEEPAGTHRAVDYPPEPGYLDRVRGTYVFDLDPASHPYRAVNVLSGITRPENGTHLWVSEDGLPQSLELQWTKAVRVNEIRITFDNNLDETLRRWHETGWSPHLVKDYAVYGHSDGHWHCLKEVQDNCFRQRVHPVGTIAVDRLRITVRQTHGSAAARVFEVRACDSQSVTGAES